MAQGGSARRVLCIDDDRDVCELVEQSLGRRGCAVESRHCLRDGLAALQEQAYDVVLADLRLGAQSGLEVCQWAAEHRPQLPVIVITAFGSLDAAVEAIRAGAYDFVTKPLELKALGLVVDRAFAHHELQQELTRLRGEAEQRGPLDELIGESAPLLKVAELVERVADTDTSVLITGDSGTGKELVARALHRRSERRTQPFVALNCSAVPPNLIESELFGHVKGAFTDARSGRPGLFVQAHGGTLFLDEIGEMPPDMQPKLLRALQERKVRPVGSGEERSFDVRIVAATNRDLESEVEEGNFREDLFYRINVVRIHVPPLKARGRDVLLLAQAFVERVAERLDKKVHGVSPEAARKLLDYDWPGNVRELENCIERAVTLTRVREISVEDLPDKIQQHHARRLVVVDDDPAHLPTMAELERRYIQHVLENTSGNKTEAARILGMYRRTFYRKLEQHGLI